MDCKKFEKHAPEYTEGLLDLSLQAAMETHRSTCRECDKLARVHESILMVLNETPAVTAPSYLQERILAAVAREETRMAAEQASYRRVMIGAMTAASAFAGLMIAVWYFMFRG